MFDKDLMLTQCGNAIYRILPQVYISENALKIALSCLSVGHFIYLFIFFLLKSQFRMRFLDVQNAAAINYVDHF